MGHYQGVPTYTIQEVLDKLPDKIDQSWLYVVRYESKILYAEDYYEDDTDALICCEEETLLEAAYEMLVWVLENKFHKEDTKWTN